MNVCRSVVLIVCLLPRILFADESLTYGLGNGKEYACVVDSVENTLIRYTPGVGIQSVDFNDSIRSVRKRIKGARKNLRGYSTTQRSNHDTRRLKRVLFNSRRLKKDLHLCQSGALAETRLHPSKACEVVGHQLSPGVSKIIKGASCSQGNSPIVKIVVNNQTICTGVIVGNRTVLTAAHCVGMKSELYRVQTGYDIYQVIKHVSHPHYRSQKHQRIEDYDVGLLQVDRDFLERRIPLHSVTDLKKGELAIIAGFGLTERNGYGQFRAGFMRVRRADGLSVSAQYTATLSDTCGGDSGGPLLVKRGLRWVLAGVTSNGNVHCTAPDDARFAALADSQIQSFLQEYIR